MRGRLITFEGIEGSGKTVQVKKLADYLKSKGKEVIVVREPGGTVIGEVIRKVVLDNRQKKMTSSPPRTRNGTGLFVRLLWRLVLNPWKGASFAASKITALTELFLFLASRAQLCKEVLLPALKQGKIVLADRFADSSLAYQAGGRGLDFSLVEKLNKIATTGLVPDLTILLDLPTKIALKRRRKNYKNDRLDDEDEEFYQRVKLAYWQLAKKEPERWRVIDGRKSIEEIHHQVLGILRQRKMF